MTTKVTRRGFVGGALALGASAVAGEVATHATSQAYAESTALPSESGVQYGFWIDTRRCVGCRDCVEACVKHNETPDDVPPRRTVVNYVSEYGEKVHVSTSCMHCADPACVRVCPAHVIEKRNDGIVVVDKARCMGCKYCFQACPFEVPHYAPSGMDKCDCCLGNGIHPGDEPYCVQACGKGALHFGTLDELQARAGEAADLLVAPTKPSCLIS